MDFPVGTRVRITDAFPYGSKIPTIRDIAQRGKLGKVVDPNDSTADGFVPVLLDELQTNPDGYGFFLPEELEVVDVVH